MSMVIGLIKFTDEEYFDDIKHGRYFFNNIKFFKKLEENEERGIKDPDEGALIRKFDPNATTFEIMNDEGKYLPINGITDISMKIDYSEGMNFLICCFACLTVDDIEWEGNSGNIKQSFIDDLKEEFGEKPGIMIISDDFKKQMEDMKYPKNAKRYNARSIEYYEDSNVEESYDFNHMTEKEITKLLFKKNNYFKKQHEYRSVLLMNKKTDGELVSTVDFSESKEQIVLKNANDLSKCKFYKNIPH